MQVAWFNESTLQTVQVANQAAALNRVLADRANADLAMSIAEVDSLNVEQFRSACLTLRATGHPIGLLPSGTNRTFRFVSRELNPGIAVFVEPPEVAGNVIQIATDHRRPEFRDVPAPVWDRVLDCVTNAPDAFRLIDERRPDLDSDLDALPEAEARLPELAPNAPGTDKRWLRDRLAKLSLRTLLPSSTSTIDATALHAGLWQVHDFLDESHSLAQQLEGEGRDQNGDYWHAIMHRREPDYSNANYWFRQIPQHPVFARLAPLARQALLECESGEAGRWLQRLGAADNWDAFAFVDLCQAANREPGSTLAQATRRIQYAEMLLLFAHTYRCAVIPHFGY